MSLDSVALAPDWVVANPQQRECEAAARPMARRGAYLLGGTQLGVLILLSLDQWHRYALTYDFSLYGQATWLISHGHLNPISSLEGLIFLRNNAELMFWPLSLVAAPFGGSPLVLLFEQDLLLCLTGVVALKWLAEILDERAISETFKRRLWLLALVAVALNPWFYETALFEFHIEVLAGLLTVLAARELWRGHLWRFCLCIALLAATGTAGTIEAVGFGLAGCLVPTVRRRFGALIVGAAGLWLICAAKLGLVAQEGQSLGTKGFGYLDPGTTHPNLFGVSLGLLSHLATAAHVVGPRFVTALLFLIPVGLIGAFRRLTFFPVAAVFGPPMLAHSSIYFRPAAAFQVWPVLDLVLIGSLDAFCCSRLASRDGTSSARIPWMALAGAGPFILAGSLGESVAILRHLPEQWLAVAPASASILQKVEAQTPAGAEVIASQGIVGRFAARADVQAVMTPRQRFAVTEPSVVFVFAPNQGILQIAPRATEAMISTVMRLPGRDVLASSHGVTAVLWHPRMRGEIWLPGGGTATTGAFDAG